MSVTADTTNSKHSLFPSLSITCIKVVLTTLTAGLLQVKNDIFGGTFLRQMMLWDPCSTGCTSFPSSLSAHSSFSTWFWESSLGEPCPGGLVQSLCVGVYLFVGVCWCVYPFVGVCVYEHCTFRCIDTVMTIGLNVHSCLGSLPKRGRGWRTGGPS